MDWARRGGSGRQGEDDGRTVTGIWSHFSSSDEPDDPANDAQEKASSEALDFATTAGLDPEVRHLANSAAAILRPSSRLDLVRCGIASYGLDPAPGVTAASGWAGDDGPRRPGHGQARRGRDGGLLRPHLDRGRPDQARPGAGRVRRRAPARGRQPGRGRSWAATPPDPRPDLHGPARRRPRRRRPRRRRRRRVFGPGTHGEPTAQDWAEACGTISYEIVTGSAAASSARRRRRHARRSTA